MTKADDEARRRILARRARFVAAALAGVSTACGKEPAADPHPCLSAPPMRMDAAPPEPCLAPQSPYKQAPDADAGDAKPAPEPCLSVARPQDAGRAPPPPPPTSDARPPVAPPQPCLKVMPPREQKR